ncbi:rna binding [Fusarium albosuccineum]|uniref:Rna binding n=1 Tax=Fusarium albosuccineum TaxID=1237068 RepID=A0A8H4LM96_9HYPO|nr:rna binding [Fusarium albosuccineum]
MEKQHVQASTNTSVSAAELSTPAQDDECYDCPVAIPGSKQNKQMYPKAPVQLKCWDQPEYQRRFEFVKGELQHMVNRDAKLRDVAQRISYELRMVGTSPNEALPSIVIRCRCDSKHMRTLQSLFGGRTQAMMHCGNDFFSQQGPIPPLKLVYFKEKCGPVLRIGSDALLEAFFDNRVTYCGGLARYRSSSATLGVSIHIGADNAHLTVDHIFEPNHGSSSDSGVDLDATSPEFTPPDSDNADESNHPWENDDDEYDYDSGDDLDEQDEDSRTCWLSNTTGPDPRVEHKYREDWQKVIPPAKLDPAMAYLDWSLTRPLSSTLEPLHLNAFSLNGRDAPTICLSKIRNEPRKHLGPVKTVSGVRGVLYGKLLAGSSFLGAAPGQADCEVWTAILNDKEGLISGECGSAVVDDDTNEIYGHVVGCNTSGHALIVPLKHVLTQVKHCFGTTLVGLSPPSTHLSPVHVSKEQSATDQALAEFDAGSQLYEAAVGLDNDGDHITAEKKFRDSMEIRERVLGLHHYRTLDSMGGMTAMLYKQGDYGRAEIEQRRLMDIQAKVLGSEHPNTLITMNNLATVLTSLRRFSEAEDMHRRTLKLREKVLGPEHADTLLSMNNLGVALGVQDRREEAMQMLHEVLARRTRILGPKHPDTVITKNNLDMAVSEGKKTALAHRYRGLPTRPGW